MVHVSLVKLGLLPDPTDERTAVARSVLAKSRRVDGRSRSGTGADRGRAKA
jgi:hypothetical protein